MEFFLIDYNIFIKFGYIGIFLISFIGSLFIFFPAPYFFPVALLSLVSNPWLVALSSATGATIAKFLIFRASFLGRKVINKKINKRIKPLDNLLSKYGGLMAFVAAATPIPDDLIYIPLGVLKYNPLKFLVLTFIGKFLIISLIAWTSRYSLPFINSFYNSSSELNYIVIIIIFIFLIIILYSIFKFNWEKILKK